jgi:hypothetical protein
MNRLERHLYKTRKTFRAACHEIGEDIEYACTPELETCTSCDIWLKSDELIPDLDGLPICKDCLSHYGM